MLLLFCAHTSRHFCCYIFDAINITCINYVSCCGLVVQIGVLITSMISNYVTLYIVKWDWIAFKIRLSSKWEKIYLIEYWVERRLKTISLVLKGISQHICHPSALHCANNWTSANTQISEDENAGEHDDHDHSDSESVATTSCITSKSDSKYCSMIIPIHVQHESCPKKEV